MTAFWVAISIALLVVWVFTVVDLFGRHLDRRQTLAWLLIVILLPLRAPCCTGCCAAAKLSAQTSLREQN